jgi:hypothetical protein
VKKREGILVTREMGGPGQADTSTVVQRSCFRCSSYYF